LTKTNKITYKTLLYPLLAVALLYFVYIQIPDPTKVWTAIKTANYGFVGLAALAGLTSHFTRALRWKLLIEPMGYTSRLKTSFYAVMVGYTVNYALPRVGEVARCTLKGQLDDVPVDKLLGTVVTERVFDVLVTLLVTVLAVVTQYDLIADFLADLLNQDQQGTQMKLVLLGGLAVMGVVGLVIYNWLRKRENNPAILVKLLDIVEGILTGVKSIFKLKKPWLFVFYTLVIWFMYFMVNYLVFMALPETSHLGLDAAVVTLVVATVAVIIPAPGGLGSFHYFVPLGLTLLYGIDKNPATSYAFISHASQMIMICVLGGISMIAAGFLKRQKRNEVAGSGE